MLPGMNPKDMAKAMKMLGIKQENIEANRVMIETNNKNIIILNPEVVKIDMKGQESFQITGEVSEEDSISEEDIKTVAGQANVSESEAKKALEKTKGDLAEAILKLQS